MEKIKSVISGNRKSVDVTRDAEASPSTTRTGHGSTGNLTGEGSHLADHQTTSTGAPGSEGYHPIYDQFKGQHGQPGTTGESTRISESPPHFSNATHVEQTPPGLTGGFGPSGKVVEPIPTSSRQHDATSRRAEYPTEDASTASIRSGVIGFPEGGYDAHASLGHESIKRALDNNQLQGGPGHNSIPDRTLGGEQKESSHLGRDTALGAGALGARGTATHELHHQKGDVGDISSETTSRSSPLERQTEPRTEHTSKGITGLFHNHGQERHPERKTEQIPQQQSSRIGEQEQSSHPVRDSALGAGTIGAGGIAAHEHNRSYGGDISRTTRQPDTLTAYGSTQKPSGLTGEQEEKSSLGRDATIGAGAIGDGGLAARTLNNRREEDTRDPISQTSGTQGGQSSTIPASTTMHFKEPGTNEEGAGVGEEHTHGRRALAGAAAAAATASSAVPLTGHEREREPTRDLGQTGAATITSSAVPSPQRENTREHERSGLGQIGAATTASSAIPSSQHQFEPSRENSHPGLGQAAATSTVASAIPLSPHGRVSIPGQEHNHAGHGHAFQGDPCEYGAPAAPAGTMFSDGPHVTDTANRVDPHLHIPGEFPDPTPAEETPEPSFGRDVGVGDAVAGGLNDMTGNEPRVRTTPAMRSDKPTSERHYGPEATIAGGVGAAGLGAATAGQHHQQDERQAGGDELHTGINPYSSKTVDPRVYGKSGPPTNTNVPSAPASHIPIGQKSTSERDTAVTKGYEGSRHLGGLQEDVQPSTTQRETNQPTSQIPQPTSPTQDEQSKNHYSRDATIVGAGAAGVGGLYTSQRDDKLDTSPASENIVDPKAQPYPSLQQHQVGSTSTPEDSAPKTTGPHKFKLANILDPRVKSDPEKQKIHPTADSSASDPGRSNRSEDKHQRDAAVVGGAGTAGYGAYEAEKAYDSHRNTQPTTAMNEQRYDPTAIGAHDPTSGSQNQLGLDSAAARGLGATGAGLAGLKPHEGNAIKSSSTQESHVHYPTSGSPEESYRGDSQHHGKETVLAGGADAAGAGGYAASRDAPKSGFAKQLSHDSPTQDTQQSDQSSQYQYGRNATVVGGSGAAGVGAYAAPSGTDNATQSSFLQQQRHDPTTITEGTHDLNQQPQQHHGRNPAVAGGVGTVGAGAYAPTSDRKEVTPQSYILQRGHHDPTTTTGTQDPSQTTQHHYARDAAVAGGLGATGAGAYAATRGNDNTHQPQLSQDNQQPTYTHQRYDSTQQPDQNQHQRRDTAALGATGVAGGAAEGYGFSQHDADKVEKERLAEQKAQQAAHEKELEHERKEQQKEMERQQKHDQKELRKEHAKEEKHHKKLVAEEEKKHEKEAAKQERKHVKEVEKLEKEEEKGEKKHHLFGFLHRDKKDKDNVTNPDASESGAPRDSADYSRGTAGEGAVGAGAYGAHEVHKSGEHDSDSDGKRERNRLHKEPPPGHPAREALEHQGQGVGGNRKHVGMDDPVGRSDQVPADHTTQAGVHDAHDPEAQKHSI